MKCRFVVVRTCRDTIHIYPVKDKVTEEEILRTVVKPFKNMMDDNEGYDFFEIRSGTPKQIRKDVVRQRVAEYANNNNCRFWLVTDVCDYYRIAGDSEDYCASMISHNFEDILRTVKRELCWSELTQEW